MCQPLLGYSFLADVLSLSFCPLFCKIVSLPVHPNFAETHILTTLLLNLQRPNKKGISSTLLGNNVKGQCPSDTHLLSFSCILHFLYAMTNVKRSNVIRAI